ncbi:MAG: FecR family protein [Gemmatimonas sp.]|jgi:ferric-dicitrate binding protein FerR (iron transport regulator)
MSQPTPNEDDLRWREATRVVAGDVDQAVAARVRAWLRETAEGDALLNDAERVWAETAPVAAVPSIAWNTDLAMQRFRTARIVDGTIGMSRGRVATDVERAAGTAPVGRWRWAMAVAAAATVALTGGALWQRASSKSTADITVASTVAVGAAAGASPRSVTLADGSEVTLAPGSSLRSAPGFGSTHRLLELDGEALFMVHPGAQAFLVKARGVLVEDVSTKFVVRGREDGLLVVVTDGAVVVGARRDTLRQGTGGVVVRDGLARPASSAELRSATAWTNGALVFNDEPLDEVAQRLSRWTGHTLRVDGALKERPVTVTFDGESPSTMFHVLATTVGASLDSTSAGWRLRSQSP